MVKFTGVKDDKKLKFRLYPRGTENRTFWKNYEINIDRYCDKWAFYKSILAEKCALLTDADLKKILKEYKVKDTGNGQTKDILIADTKTAIDFLCVISFAEKSPKVLSRHFKISIKANKIDKRKIILKVLESRMKEQLTELFFLVISQNRGSAKYGYKIHDPNKKFSFESAEKIVTNLIRFLNRKSDIEYDCRFIDKIGQDYYFLLIKETGDKIVCALPENVRVQTGQYVLIRWDASESLFSIDTRDFHESTRIKNYIARKTKLTLRYTKEQGTYNSDQFLAAILSPVNNVQDLVLLELQARNSTMGDQTIKFSDNKKKNNITDLIKQAVDTNMINLRNFSNYKSLSFSFKDISYTVQFRLDKFNHTKLHLVDQRKPAAEVNAFKHAFSTKYEIPFNAFLKNEDETADLIQITRKMVADKTVSAEMPPEYEDLVVRLINEKFLYQPTESGKRRCVECNSVFWEPGDCKQCGNEPYFEGEYLDIEVNEAAFDRYLFKAAGAIKSAKVKRVKRQIAGSAFHFIEIMDAQGNTLSIYTCRATLPEKLIAYFKENGLPLLIVLVKYKEALYTTIKNQKFECIDFAEIANNSVAHCTGLLESAITNQKNTWQIKVIEKGAVSFSRLLTKPKGYDDQDFERDIYNLIHEMFLVSDRMGEKLTGVKAPDGIACLQNYAKPLKRTCIAWDCKFSQAKRGYALNEKPAKHKHYLERLTANEKVVFFGGLGIYAFITHNMNMVKYVNFYKKFTNRLKWRGQVLILPEKNILDLYKVYKDNEELIQSYPAIFYGRLLPLFTKIPAKESSPYKWISSDRMIKIFESLQVDFKKVHRQFKFNRDEFK